MRGHEVTKHGDQTHSSYNSIIDDMIVDLNCVNLFSKLDLRQGYHQLELSPQSRNVTTFKTHVGLRRYKRLSFGINSAAEIFQNAIQNALEGLEGV